MTALAELIVVDLGDRETADCIVIADGLREKLDTPKYTDGVSLMPVPGSLEDWRGEHRTARKRADRCERLGYRFDEIDRSLYAEDIFAINTSLERRQGRPMSPGYLSRDLPGRLPIYRCPSHYIRTYGVLQDETLRAYLTLYRSGDLALVSMILGHGDYLRDDIMYLLFAGVVADQAGQGGWFYYNSHASGTDGLRFFKERLGFRSADVAWS